MNRRSREQTHSFRPRYHLPVQGYVRVQKVSGARGRLIFTRLGEDMLPREMGIKEFKRKAELIPA